MKRQSKKSSANIKEDDSFALSQSDLFPVGKVVGFVGLRGDLKIRPSTNNPALLMSIDNVEVRLPSGAVLNKQVEHIRVEKRMIIVRLSGIEDRTAAQQFLDAEILTSRDELEPLEDEEFWISDLVGLDAYTTEGKFVGKVASIIDGGNQILEIDCGAGSEGKTILIPFVKALVPELDLKSKRLTISAIPGLLEPQ
jgi:16S rRNA processing protein RimM